MHCVFNEYKSPDYAFSLLNILCFLTLMVEERNGTRSIKTPFDFLFLRHHCYRSVPSSAGREFSYPPIHAGLFQVAIPIVPTIRVVVTFTKFEQLQPTSELLTPESGPGNSPECRASEAETSSSWYSWIRGSHHGGQSSEDGKDRSWKDEVDPFRIPSDYTWVDADETKQKMSGKRAKPRKTSSKSHATKTVETQQSEDGFEGLD